MIDKVEIVSRSDGHRATAAFSDTRVSLVQRLMNKDEREDDCVAVNQWKRDVVTDRYQTAVR